MNKLKKIGKFFHDVFFDLNGNLRKWLILSTALLIPLWGVFLTMRGNDNTEQIDTLTKLITQSQKQLVVLQEISGATDNTSKSIKNLQELPKKLAEFSIVLDTLNSSIGRETKKLGESYATLNKTNLRLNDEQIKYLEKISKVIDLTNAQIKELDKNNKLISAHYSRRANILISASPKKVNGKFYIDEIIVENFGAIECGVKTLVLKIMNKDYVCSDTAKLGTRMFISEGRNNYRLINDVLYTEIHVGQNMAYGTKNLCPFDNKNIEITYLLTYKNDLENQTIEGRVIIK